MNQFEERQPKRRHISLTSKSIINARKKQNVFCLNHDDGRLAILDELRNENRSSQFEDQRFQPRSDDPHGTQTRSAFLSVSSSIKPSKNQGYHETLTHRGRSISDMEEADLNKETYISDQEEEGFFDQSGPTLIQSHFGQGDASSKSRKQIYQELISKSKLYRAERARLHEEQLAQLEDLESAHTLLQSDIIRIDKELEKAHHVSGVSRKNDEYQQLLHSLQFDTMARASFRTKTPEEIAREQVVRLKQLELERQLIKECQDHISESGGGSSPTEEMDEDENDSEGTATDSDNGSSAASDDEDDSSEPCQSDPQDYAAESMVGDESLVETPSNEGSSEELSDVHLSTSKDEVAHPHTPGETPPQGGADQVHPPPAVSTSSENILEWAKNDPIADKNLPFYYEFPPDIPAFTSLLACLEPTAQWKVLWRLRVGHQSTDPDKNVAGRLLRYLFVYVQSVLENFYASKGLRKDSPNVDDVVVCLETHLADLSAIDPQASKHLLLTTICELVTYLMPDSDSSEMVLRWKEQASAFFATKSECEGSLTPSSATSPSQAKFVAQLRLCLHMFKYKALTSVSELQNLIHLSLEAWTLQVLKEMKSSVSNSRSSLKSALQCLSLYELAAQSSEVYFPLFIQLISSVLTFLSPLVCPPLTPAQPTQKGSRVVSHEKELLGVVLEMASNELERLSRMTPVVDLGAQTTAILSSVAQIAMADVPLMPQYQTLLKIVGSIRSRKIPILNRVILKVKTIRMLTPKFIDCKELKTLRSPSSLKTSSSTKRLKKEHSRLRKSVNKQIRQGAAVVAMAAGQSRQIMDQQRAAAASRVRRLMEQEAQDYHKMRTSVAIKRHVKTKKRHPQTKKKS